MDFEQRLREWIAATWSGRMLGIELSPVSHAERLISMAGGFLAILLLIVLEQHLLGETGAAMLIGSMGASAVLLFAVPHGALSQPWAVIIGHVVSATVGVTCARWVSDPTLAAALAVGLAIAVMHYLRAIHPPGGATALTAVIGGPQVAELGYAFVVTPVLVNALLMTVTAVAINAAFVWRRYPVALARTPGGQRQGDDEDAMSHADFVSALKRIGTFVDISESEFLALRTMMREEAARRRLKPEEVRLGNYYSNGADGVDFCVRRVVDQESDLPDGRVIWKVVAGLNREQTGISTRSEFANWACCEVQRAETAWMRKPLVAKT
jgi:CBS domain-containing membrane protein